ncbi:MAG: helix-turn-helix domain-containing protein [Candidatus Paceibacterota bacterium]
MRTDKTQALKLRSEGKSYNEITQALGMSKSTLTSWFKGVDFSEAVKKYLSDNVQKISTQRLVSLNKARGSLLQAHYAEAEKEALRDIDKNINNPLFVAAVAAYWGEGDKANNAQVRIINTDPQMILIFKRFLLEICQVPEERLRGALYIYEDLKESECKKFWTQKTGLTNFHKTMVLPSRHKSKKVRYGMCTLLVTNTYLKKKMLVWIDRLPNMVLNSATNQ